MYLRPILAWRRSSPLLRSQLLYLLRELVAYPIFFAGLRTKSVAVQRFGLWLRRSAFANRPDGRPVLVSRSMA